MNRIRAASDLFLVILIICYGARATEEPGHNKIWRDVWEWWKQMEIQKPVSCKVLPMEEALASDPRWAMRRTRNFIECYQCPKGTKSSVDFTIKGNIEMINEKCSGGGQVTINPGLNPFEIETNGVCLSVQPDVAKVIGKFSDGRPKGAMKIHFASENVMIANFENGEMNGLIRRWNSAGQLYFMSNQHHGQSVGDCWERSNGTYLFQYKCNPFVDNDTQVKTLIFHPQVPEKTYEAELYISRYVTSNVRPIQLTGLSTEFCSPRIHYNVNRNHPVEKYVVKALTGKTIQISSACTDFVKSMGSLSPSELLFQWLTIDRMEDFIEQQFHVELQPEKAVTFLTDVFFKDLSGQVTLLGTTFPVIPVKITLDKENRCHGFCQFKWLTDFPLYDNFTFDSTLIWKPFEISATFEHGVPEGPFTIQLHDTRYFYGRFRKGIMHGPAIIINTVPQSQRDEIKVVTIRDGFGMVGNYVNGRLTGPVWIGLHGGGYLHGVLDKNSQFSGDSMSYLYPDLKTAFVGRFENKEMKDAQESQVLEVTCTQDGLLRVSQFAEPSGPHFYYEPPSNESFGAGPNVPDPYEIKYVQLGQTTLNINGQGLFATQDIPKGRVFVTYSGFAYTKEQWNLYGDCCYRNESKTEDYRRHCWKYALETPSLKKTVTIPPEMDKPGDFQPTLGPKINHHFGKNYTDFYEFEHPRWGMIMSLITKQDIKAGDEIFTFYNYQPSPFPTDYPWYWEAKKKFDEEQKKEENKQTEVKKPKKKSGKPKRK